MIMCMRWYGEGHDTVTLEQIRQSCYAKGVITTLYDKQPGEVAMPGYGLYDRALGAAYICGLWEAVEKELGPRA